MVAVSQNLLDAQGRLRARWLRFLDDSRAELDELTIAANLGVLTAEWLVGLPDELADSRIGKLAEQLEVFRAGVS